MAKKYKYEVHEYWRNDMTATDDMAAHMNEMSAEGWEVFDIKKTPNSAELSHYPSDQACFDRRRQLFDILNDNYMVSEVMLALARGYLGSTPIG